MNLLAIISGLVALLAAIALWLLSLASQSLVMQRFPEYGAQIYRVQRQALQQGPVRTYRLPFVQPPVAADAAIHQMRLLALVAWAGAIAAVALWLRV
jgi:hypothetical protein